MKKMKNKVFWFWVAGIVCCAALFFVGFPKLLPFLLIHIYGVDNVNTENTTMQNYGLVGDSYGIYNALFSAFLYLELFGRCMSKSKMLRKLRLSTGSIKCLTIKKSLSRK